MDTEKILPQLVQKNESKILLVVIDGLGGLPHPDTGLTELEGAHIPNLDALAHGAACGLMIPVALGVTPGSGPAHLGLFGYDPIKYQIGRGILECLGIGLSVGKEDLAIRGNFATIDSEGVVTDRRAGRISTEENRRLVDLLQKEIGEISGAKFTIKTVKEHRVAIVVSGGDLSAAVTENDPQKEGKRLRAVEPVSPEGDRTAKLLTEFLRKSEAALKTTNSRANTLLLRGFSKLPEIPTFTERYLLKAACVASYPMYKGLAKLVGMDILSPGDSLEDQLETIRQAYQDYDFFYLHLKKTDSMGEDGNFSGKIQSLEQIDSKISAVKEMGFEVVVITGDHSTPSSLRGHSWHPVPFMLLSRYIIPDHVNRFTERECAEGMLGLFHSTEAMMLMLACSLRLQKFGA
ncbi:MAG: 2,3-bisphosphoglycerate-independent phosphoglycerate mutase [Candidatus Omnitrophica bacterium]|nr:2,3-bisphosphoglycerate-independent phosphoglycerate mutase [Candidatus Omnitrophota bacterium]MCM8769172.1 2,3-bisphosphoglycerate-independent phosphoglycerate mutase [Candidatus Omnitrophota bacterium]